MGVESGEGGKVKKEKREKKEGKKNRRKKGNEGRREGRGGRAGERLHENNLIKYIFLYTYLNTRTTVLLLENGVCGCPILEAVLSWMEPRAT